MKSVAPLLLALAAAACAATPTETAPAADAGAVVPSPTTDTCGAGMFAALIGKPIDGGGVPGASRLVRHILPGTQVTMDYIAQRMNIEADAGGIIRKINCG